MGAVVSISMLWMMYGIRSVLGEVAQTTVDQRLEAASRSFDRYLTSRTRFLEAMVASVAETAHVKSTLELGDRETAAVCAREAQPSLEGRFVVLTNAEGKLLAHTAGAGANPDAQLASAIRIALGGQRYSGILTDDHGPFLAGAAPVTVRTEIGERLVGVILAGERVDARLATEFREAIGIDVLVTRGQKAVAWSMADATSVEPEAAAKLLAAGVASHRNVQRIRASDIDRFALTRPFGATGQIVLSNSATDLIALEGHLSTLAIKFGTLAAAVAALLGIWISRRLTGPLRDLVSAADDVAGGDLDTVVSESGTQETVQLGRAFNHMTQHVRQLVNDVRHKAEVLQQQKNELEWANQVQRNFLVSASHELRTPITSISSSSEILLHHGGDDEAETRQEFLSIIENETERLTGLLTQMLKWTEVEAALSCHKVEAFDLPTAVEETLAAFRRGKGHGRRVTFQVTSQANTCLGDRPAIQQLIEQLLDNVHKFTPPDSDVTVLLRDGELGIELHIEDQGPGIPDEDMRRRVFERFVQGGDILTEKPPGVGLGLAICTEIATTHGGEVRCEQSESGGALFIVTLPWSIIDAPAERERVSTQVGG